MSDLARCPMNSDSEWKLVPVGDALSLFGAFVSGVASREVQERRQTRAQADAWIADAKRTFAEHLGAASYGAEVVATYGVWLDGVLWDWDESREGAEAIAARLVPKGQVRPLYATPSTAEEVSRRAREEAAEAILAQADTIGRVMAAGWRGNPHMSGDDRNFMHAAQRRRHDDQSRFLAEHLADAIRAIAKPAETGAGQP